MSSNKGSKIQLGIRLRGMRDKIGMSQQEVADSIGSTRDRISNYETGRANPKPNDIAALAELFRTSSDYLLGKTDDPLPWYSRLSVDFRDLMTKMSNDGDFFEYIKADIIESLVDFEDHFEDDFAYTPKELASIMDDDYSLFFKSELYGNVIGVAIKHGLVDSKNKNPHSLANEKEFAADVIELSDEDITKKFTLVIDGQMIDEKQMKRLIAFARMDRENM